MHDFIIHMLLAPFFHIDEKTKMYFLKDIINMLSEKKVSKKSPSKMNISSVLEQIGLLSRGKSEHMLTPEGGGIAERPLTATNTYNIRRSRNIKRCSGCCLQRRVVGGLGAKPPGIRVQGRCSCWVWAKPTVCPGNQEEAATLRSSPSS